MMPQSLIGRHQIKLCSMCLQEFVTRIIAVSIRNCESTPLCKINKTGINFGFPLQLQTLGQSYSL